MNNFNLKHAKLQHKSVSFPKFVEYQDSSYTLVSKSVHRTRKNKVPFNAYLYAEGKVDIPEITSSNKDFSNKYDLGEDQIYRFGRKHKIVNKSKENDQKLRHQGVVSHNPVQEVIEKSKNNNGVISHVGAPIVNMTPPESRSNSNEVVSRSNHVKHVLLNDIENLNVDLGNHDNPLNISFDAEWYVPKSKFLSNKNRKILTIQLAFRGIDGKMYVWILSYPVNSKSFRISDSTALRWFFEDTKDLTGFTFFKYKKKKDVDKNNDQYPYYHVFIVGHYGIVDWTSFFNGNKKLREMDTIRRTLTTIEKPIFYNITSSDRHENRKIIVNVRDTMHLSSAGSSLANLGKAMNMPKITLPEGYGKDEMNRLLIEKPGVFVVYSATDAVITLSWVEQMFGTNKRIPVTLGGQAAKILRSAICEYNGWKKVSEFDEKFRGLRNITDTEGKRRILEPKNEAAQTLQIANNCFYGGRNEAFLFGIHHAKKAWYDLDLSGAYTTAMTQIPDIDFDKHPTSIVGELYEGQINPFQHVYGLVEFEFPENTLYPCLPVKDTNGRGLIFPLKGETWASSPELFLALKMGARIRFVQPGIVHPVRIVDGNHVFSLAQGVIKLVEERKKAKEKYGKGSPQELAAKTMANSSYGKLAQGLSGKRAYSTRHDRTSSVPPSAVTAAPYAAMTTSWVRAVVSAAMVQLGEQGYRIASVTTDGFLTDAPPEVITKLDLFGFRDHFVNARKWLANEEEIWELKHAAKSLVMLKTRGGFGVGPIDEHKLPSAAAGYKVFDEEVKNRVDEIGKSEALAELFLKREGRLCFSFHSLPSPKDYVRKNADAVGKTQKKSISWEWDFKRKPNNDAHLETISIEEKEYEHLSFSSLPWKDFEEFDNARAATDGSNHALKSVNDFEDVMKKIDRRPKAALIGIKNKGGVAKTEARSVLRGLRSGVLSADWYIPGETKSRDVLSRVSEAFGVTLNANDWKNAGRKGRIEKILLDGLDDKLKELDINQVKSIDPPINNLLSHHSNQLHASP